MFCCILKKIQRFKKKLLSKHTTTFSKKFWSTSKSVYILSLRTGHSEALLNSLSFSWPFLRRPNPVKKTHIWHLEINIRCFILWPQLSKVLNMLIFIATITNYWTFPKINTIMLNKIYKLKKDSLKNVILHAKKPSLALW